MLSNRSNNTGTIDGLLSPEACDEYVRFSGDKRYEEAPVSTDRGAVMVKDLRNNDRAMLDDYDMARRFYELVKGVLPQSFQKKWRPLGLNAP